MTDQHHARPAGADDGPSYDGVLTPWIGVTDLAKSVAWYEDMLGLKVEYTLDEVGWCELGTGVARVALGLYRMDEVNAAGGATLTFGVLDLDRERARLEERGVRFEGPTKVIPGTLRMASFRDPDGNPLMFCQVLGTPRH
ncbi:VOC family protein [Streptomyces sp. NRRL B-1347]|uniref:VOC family protein n=1 Tax=Streptomyces sp. NRRL B-1347 TaxID=1476877 RepID=UPI00068DE032|nr:VOC family protein [Streptomyces sp. NRRL B-1347]